MTFVFPVLLGGLALAGVPILLHLIVRQKPKHLPFPAFRFLLQRHRTNQRKLRLRHLLLLALRVLLIVLICLAVARPKISGGKQSLSSGPVAAVLVFDTGPSMEYEILGLPGRRPPPPGAKHWNLLDDAKRRGLELLGSLHQDSRVAVLDTARAAKVWLSVSQAENRIKQLKVRADSVSVTDRLADAYDLIDRLARDADESRRSLPRFVYVFSDRSRGCWDDKLLKKRQDEADRIPVPLGLVRALPDRTPPLANLLSSLADRLQLSGGAPLVGQLNQLREAAVRADDTEDPAPANQLLTPVRGQVRELLRQLEALGDQVPKGTKEYRDKLAGQLHDFLADFEGVYAIFVDVGVDKPMDLAVERLELPPQIDNPEAPRQMFWANETFPVRVVVRATGAAYDPLVHCLVDGRKVGEKQVKGLAPGSSRVVDFKVSCAGLGPGTHQLEVTVPKSLDRLRFDDGRYATFVVGQPRKVLTIADTKERADWWRQVVNATMEYQCRVVTPAEFEQLKDLRDYPAICLFEVDEPSAQVWTRLKEYVDAGGGLVVVPPRDEENAEASKRAYNSLAARRLLPGRLVQVINRAPEPGVLWDWQQRTYQHPILRPFLRWNRNPQVDFVKVPRRADRYWQVERASAKVDVLVSYADKGHNPAILERYLGTGKRQGKVLLFTTALDGGQGWNNYLQTDSTFCVMLPHLTFRYLAGSPETVQLNFQSGQPVLVPLPLKPRLPPYSVEGPELEGSPSLLEVPKTQGELRVRGAVRPGNYPVFDTQGNRVAGFSVNVPSARSELDKVPVGQITALFGPRSVLPVSGDVKLPDVLRYHWGQPRELLPFLLLAVLGILVVESLLANKFYRRTGEPPAEGAPQEQEQPSV